MRIYRFEAECGCGPYTRSHDCADAEAGRAGRAHMAGLYEVSVFLFYHTPPQMEGGIYNRFTPGVHQCGVTESVLRQGNLVRTEYDALTKAIEAGWRVAVYEDNDHESTLVGERGQVAFDKAYARLIGYLQPREVVALTEAEAEAETSDTEVSA